MSILSIVDLCFLPAVCICDMLLWIFLFCLFFLPFHKPLQLYSLGIIPSGFHLFFLKTTDFIINKAAANAPVPVTADMNIKVPVNLKLQPRRHTHTLIFSSIHLMYLMIHFLCRKLKKVTTSENFFRIWHLFILRRYCNYKQIRWQYTSSAFVELKVPLFKTVLKLQTNSLTVYG